MAEDRAAQLESLASGTYRPTTFLERGVAVPFTTPLLLGARLRPANRKGLEIVMNNLSGGKGFYVVSWSALNEICSPSLHDDRLFQALSGCASPCPADIRRATRQVAQEGWGGRAAARAAEQAEAGVSLDRMRLNLRLLQQLIRQTETVDEASPPVERDLPDQQQARAKRAILRASRCLGRTREDVIVGLEALAETFHEVGLPAGPQTPRLRRILADIAIVGREIDACLAATPVAQEAAVGLAVNQSFRLTHQCGEALIGQVDTALSDILTLLRRWHDTPRLVANEAMRLDWLLDGWPLILNLWQQTELPQRQRAAREVAMLLPVLPEEAGAWCGFKADWELPDGLRQVVKAKRDWRHGRPVDLTARNERLLAATL